MLKELTVIGMNILMGIVIGICISYFLYRFSIPAKAFIYVTF